MDHRVRRQGQQVESKDRREHGAVALDRGNTEGFGRPQPAEEVGHLNKR